MPQYSVKANFQAAPDGVRRDVFDGREYMVVPVVMIVDGVLNDALVTQEEYGRYVEAWNGRPIPVLHPQENGGYISANRPDVWEKNTIGQIFNARCVNGRLKADAWIDVQKAQRLGYCQLLTDMEAGLMVEVSTGYFADDDPTPGNFNGQTYSVVHRNIRPDHLALLPGETGACSVADGCGTRVNTKMKGLAMKVNEAIATLAKAVGVKTNCDCHLLALAEKKMKANAITPAQFEMVQDMAPEDRQMLGAIIQALGDQGEPVEAPEEEMPAMADTPPEEATPAPAVNKEKPKAMTADDINKLIANGIAKGVDEAIRRRDVVGKLTANERNELTADEMAGMSIASLEKIEKAIRPADYSGQGGFASNSSAMETNVTPLVPGGLMANRKKGESK